VIMGYAGKFLDVNLSSKTIRETKFSDEILENYIGGRGLASKILWDRIGKRWERTDPLGASDARQMLTSN
jgi:aldehyde:ferredoxin oxidoreductase